MSARGVVAACLASASLLGAAPVTEAATDDFVYVTAKEDVAPGTFGFIDAGCPAGSRAIGSGGSVKKSNGVNAWISEIHTFDKSFDDADTDEDDGAVIGVFNTKTKPARATVYAICSFGVDNVNLTYNRSIYNVDSGQIASSQPGPCAAGGQPALAGGAGVPPGPFDHLTQIFVNETNVTGGIRGVNPVDRSLTVYAVCQSLVSRTVTFESKQVGVRKGRRKTIKVLCPKKTDVVAGGANGGALVDLLSSRPVDGKDKDHTPDDGWSVRVWNRRDQTETVTAQAVCVGAFTL